MDSTYLITVPEDRADSLPADTLRVGFDPPPSPISMLAITAAERGAAGAKGLRFLQRRISFWAFREEPLLSVELKLDQPTSSMGGASKKRSSSWTFP